MKPFAELATLTTRHVDENHYLANDWLTRGAYLLPDNLFSRADSLDFDPTFKIIRETDFTKFYFEFTLDCKFYQV